MIKSELFPPNSQKRLWIYGVIIKLTNENGQSHWVAKCPGQTLQYTLEDARKYIANQTFGKLRGIFTDNMISFCIDMTENAISDGYSVDNNFAKYDDHIRPQFPGYDGHIKNEFGGTSNELLTFDNDDFDSINFQLINTIEKISGQSIIRPTIQYTLREYAIPPLTDKFDSNKLLLAGCTGSGKEAITLTYLIHFNDKLHKSGKLSTNKLHVSVATIPSTVMELFKELSSIHGMNNRGKFYDFSRIIPYVLSKFKKDYGSILNVNEMLWFNQNVKVVDSVKDIPDSHDKNKVPILFGSFHDIGLGMNGNKLKTIYHGLEDRIGILSIGESHKFLCNPNNIMWSNIDSLKREFLILITGTPYDYIFNDEDRLYFRPNDRVVFTWMDLMKQKRSNPTGPFGKYPNVIYYGLPNLSDYINELKKDPNWVDDIHSFTYKKLFTTFNSDGSFTYEHHIITLFKRLFRLNINPLTNTTEGLNINSAPDLCEKAKRHVIVTLPSGQADHGVSDYIPQLTKLLEYSGILSEYRLLEVYKDSDIGTVNKAITEDTKKTITFTCTKYLTGTNIPAWGSVIFLRPIGDSVKLFEQITGRIKRQFTEKTNCGVFVGNIDEVMNLEITVAEKVSMMKSSGETYAEIIKSVLNCYQFFSGGNGSWEKIDFPNLELRLEELSVRGNYGVGGCIRELSIPKDFNEIFNTVVNKKLSIDVVDNGKTLAKNINKRTVAKQLKLFTDELIKQRKKEIWFRTMVKKHLARVRLLCYTDELKSLQEAVNRIETALQKPNLPENKSILNQIGKGVEWIPYYMLDNNQVDISYVNRWIHKINPENISLDNLLTLMESKELHDEKTAYYPTPMYLFDEMIEKLINEKQIPNPRILDPVGGRGTSIISFIRTYRKFGIDLDIRNIYYCDIDPTLVKVFRKINKKYKLGIPDENIFCENVLKPSNEFKKILMKKFDVILGNWPYEKPVGGGNTQQIWGEFTKLFLTKHIPSYLMAVHPTGWRNVSGQYKYIQNLIKENNLIYLNMNDVTAGKQIFNRVTPFDWFLIKTEPYHGTTEISDIDHNIKNVDISQMEFIPNNEIDMVLELLSNSNPVEVLYDTSYHHQLKHMNREKTDEFKYPCVYSIIENNIPTFHYSNIKKGHFGIPKLILGNGANPKCFIDYKGEYGMTQFAFGIIDEPKNLENIKKALESDKFQKINMATKFFATAGNPLVYPRIISMFRKDFWKEFI